MTAKGGTVSAGEAADFLLGNRPMQKRLQELTRLTRALGRDDLRLAIVGEGNTSVALDDGTFWIKASGYGLADIDADGFCRVRSDAALRLLDDPRLTDATAPEALRQTLVDPRRPRPSIETFLHALCLAEPGVRFVAHTHPDALLRILCSRSGTAPFLRHFYPFAVLTCGRHVARVGYHHPGLALARAVRRELQRFRRAHGAPPRLILMANHGIVALADNPRAAFEITIMADKWARLLEGVRLWGGSSPLPASALRHLLA